MAPRDGSRHLGLNLVRHGLGAVLVIAGMVMIAVNPSGLGVDGFAMAVGGGGRRAWKLAPGVVTPEEEARERQRR